MIFNLWSPHRTAPDRITFDVTRANAPRVGAGTREWVQHCLASLDIDASPQTWSVEASRCHFYSDYADEPDWRDRWPETWTVRVSLDQPRSGSTTVATGLPRTVDEYDRSWQYGAVDPNHDRRALLVLLHPGDVDPTRELIPRTLAALPSPSSVLHASSSPVGDSWTMHRVAVEFGFLQGRAELMDRAVDQFRRQGLVTNYRDAF